MLFSARKILDGICKYSIIQVHSLMYFSWLQRTQWFSLSKLEEIQRKRLRFLLEHAFRHVPFYRKVFRAKGLRPSDIKSAEDLVKLPIVTKGDIRNNFHDFLSRDFQKYGSILNSTSGSTGDLLGITLTEKPWALQTLPRGEVGDTLVTNLEIKW